MMTAVKLSMVCYLNEPDRIPKKDGGDCTLPTYRKMAKRQNIFPLSEESLFFESQIWSMKLNLPRERLISLGGLKTR